MTSPKSGQRPPMWVIGILLVLSPILAVLFICLALLALPGMLLVTMPILRTLQLQPLYWMSAHDVKRMSGKTKDQVLDTLRFGQRCGDLQCQFRDVTTLRRLERILKRAAPKRVYPITNEEVIFFEFRPKWRGGKRSKKRFYWRVLVPRYATT